MGLVALVASARGRVRMTCLPFLSLRAVAIFAIALASLWGLWRMYQRGVDPADLILGQDGKASWSKITAIGAFLVISWAVVVMAVSGHLSDTLLLGYAAVYSGVPVAMQLINSRAQP